jgi:transcription antitermination factor NusG
VNTQASGQIEGARHLLHPAIAGQAIERKWYAVFTVPQHEKTVVKHLDIREVESFLPTYETVQLWKNRQRMKVVLPLFPSYLFVHINYTERVRVLQSPGVLQIVGNCKEHAALLDSEMEFLRLGVCGRRVEPFHDFVTGEKVRIKCGVMQGLQGTLVRKCNSIHFVLTLELINQHAAIQVNAEDLEPIAALA